MKRLAERTGLTDLLERVGVRGRLGEWIRLAGSAAERERWRLLSWDLATGGAPFRRLAEGAPAGDPRKLAWMICSLPTVWGLKMEGALSLAVRLAGFSPMAVYLHHDRFSRRYHGLFGLERSVNFERYRALTPAGALAPECEDILHGRPAVRDLLRLSYRDVDVGRVALSNVLNRRKFARFDPAEPATRDDLAAELARVQRNVLAAERLVSECRPAVALLLEKGLSPMAELFGVCVREGVPVVQYVGSQRMNSYVLKRYHRDNRYQHPFSLDAETWERVKRMPWDADQEAELMAELDESYAKGTWFDRKFLHQGKRVKPPDELRRQLGLDPAKKTAVIFSHVLWDATFFYGEGLFDDYETWLVETVRAACANPRVNWVVKLHPDLVWKLKYEGYTGELRDTIAVRSAVGTLPAHVTVVPPDTDLSTFSFFPVTDYCLTVRGTIGIEMACRGVPVLTAGTGRYSGLGFTIDSGSAREYLGRLARIETTPPLAPGEVELARRFAHALFTLRRWDVRSVEMIKAPLSQTGHVLDHDLVARVESFAELAAAADVRRFVEWLASDDVDYLEAR